MVTRIGVLAAESFPDADDVDGDGDCCDGVLEQEASARIPATINMSDRAPRGRAGANETIISLLYYYRVQQQGRAPNTAVLT